MALKDKLPVSYLLFTSRGRINRGTYWLVSVFIWAIFYVLYNLLQISISYTSTLLIYPLLFWTLACTATKRLHDTNKSGFLLLLVLIPVLGPLILIFLMGFKKGNVLHNRYGAVPGSAPDYYKNNDAEPIPHLKTGERIVNDITQLNPVLVSKVEVPKSVEELQEIIKNAGKPVSIGGGRFSMGGQTASPHSIHIDMRSLNSILDFSKENKTIKVESGTRWCDIQKYIDSFNLSVKIMQSYANFTVGGALSVNCHGRYIGLGPVILADGSLAHASPIENAELFFASIGCYNAVAVIVSAELELEENVPMLRKSQKMKTSAYRNYFMQNVRNNKDVILHNGDIYAPHYKTIRAVSWLKTDLKPTVKTRLMPLASAYPVERYFINAFSKNKFGKWRREFIIDPLLHRFKKVHWRNYEAGYDVLELEPASRKHSTYILQEYFVPVEKFDDFCLVMAEIFTRHNVNVVNVSIRHANADSGSLLAWAKEEVFAFVIYYKQKTDEAEKGKVSVWTRELTDAANSLNGSFYLPYQPHATAEQFFKAYPNAQKLFDLKKKLDPEYKFRNVIWDTYYQPN